MLFVDYHTGWCDFCGTNAGTYVKTDGQSTSLQARGTDAVQVSMKRDICENCVKIAFTLVNGKTVTQSNDKQPDITTMFNAIMKRLLDKDTKTLIKAGLLNNDLTLTAKGNDEVNALFLQNNLKALVEVAEERIAEEKESAK